MKIIRALVAGERDPAVLASHRDRRCRATPETIQKALVGNDREEHIVALAQAVELYDTCREKIAEPGKRRRTCPNPPPGFRLDVLYGERNDEPSTRNSKPGECRIVHHAGDRHALIHLELHQSLFGLRSKIAVEGPIIIATREQLHLDPDRHEDRLPLGRPIRGVPGNRRSGDRW